MTNRRLSDYVGFIGLIILTIIVVWGLLHAAKLFAPWLSSLFSRPVVKIEVKAPESTTTSSPFDLTWNYTPDGEGIYVFVHQCKEGLDIFTEGAGGGVIKIPCGAAFTVNDNNSITLTPQLTGDEPVSVPLSIAYIPAIAGGAKRVEGSAIVSIVPAKEEKKEAAKPEEKKAETTTPTAKTTVLPRPSGAANLSVRIASMTIDTAYGIGTVTFDITNIGTGASGGYYFIANLPTYSGYYYSSTLQESLGPGDHIVNTLRFEQAVPGTVTITADPASIISDSDRSNNSAVGTLGAPGASPGYQYPY